MLRVYWPVWTLYASKPLERLEFCFKGAYFPKGMKLKDLDKNFISKIEKSIKRFSGIDAKIFPLSYIV